MNNKHIFKRLMCVLLTILMVVPELYSNSIYAVNSIQTTLLEKDPIIGMQFDDPEATEDVLNEPEVNSDSRKQRNNWRMLKNYDHLPYNEIHKRVQNNIWNDQSNMVDDGELKIVYNDGTYGFADISYRSDLESLTYIWEVKPSSYRGINQAKGLNQLKKYVEASANYRNGSLSPNSIHNSSFSFNLTLSCLNGYDEWIEYVTYNVSYEVLGNGLIIYDFIRNYTKEKKHKDEKTNSEAETVSDILFWSLFLSAFGGGDSNTGSGDNISDDDSKPSITQIQGGKQNDRNDRKVAISAPLVIAVAAGTAVALPYLITHAKVSSLKGFIKPLSVVAGVVLFIEVNGTLVHAQEGDYFVLSDTPENNKKVQIINDAEVILEELLIMDVPESTDNEVQYLPYGESPLLLTFATQNGSHEVIGYGQEFGKWSFNERNYDARILVWDSIYPDTLHEESCIYYDSKTFEYCIPQYGVDSHNKKEDGIIRVSNVRNNLNAYLYQSEQCIIMGDINLDGEVSPADIMLLCDYLTTEESFSEIQFQLSDLSGDKKVNAIDLTLLKRRLLV